MIWDYGWRYFIEDSFFRSADYLIVLDENMTYVFSQDEELGGLPYFDRKETGAAFERQFEAAPTIFNPPIPDSTRHVLSLFEFEEERNLVLEQLLKESHSSFALLDMASVNPLQNLKEFPRWEDVFTQHELKAYMLERAPAALESQTIAVLDTKRIADVVSAGWDFYPWIESAVLTYETKIAEVVLTLRMSLSSDETEDTTTHLFELIKRLLELIWPKTWLGEALRGEVVGFEHGPIQSSKWNMGTDGKFLVFPKPDLPTLNRWIDPERVRFNVGVWEIGGLGGSGRNDEKPKDFEELFVNWNSLNLENFIDHRQFLKRLASQAEPEQTS